MGVGRRRTNIDVVSTGRQVVTEGGGAAIDCSLTAQCDVSLLEGVRVAIGRSGSIRLDRVLGLVLEVDGQAVATLDRGMVADKMGTCIQRGYGYVGTLVNPRTVLVDSAP